MYSTIIIKIKPLIYKVIYVINDILYKECILKITNKQPNIHTYGYEIITLKKVHNKPTIFKSDSIDVPYVPYVLKD